MTLKDKILVFGLPILLGSFVTFGIGHSVYNYLERRENRILEQAKYDLRITKPDALVPIGDIDGNGFADYIVLDSFEDKENNKDLGRGFLFLGHNDGICYPIERFSFSEERRKEIMKSAYEMAELKNALLSKKKN